MVLVLVFVALFANISLTKAKESDISTASVIKLVNEARKDAGVGLLMENPKLKAAAEKKARDMVEKNYFAHISPEGKSPWDWIQQEGYDYRFAGENLAIDYTSAKEQQEAWMDSPLHRKNILNPDYKEIGVAAVKGMVEGRKTTVTVQEFGTKMVIIAEPTLVQKEILPNKTAVAGISINVPESPKTSLDSLSLTAKNQLKLGEIFENNRLTLAGWLSVFILAILFTLTDMLFLLHKKHKNHLFIRE